MTRMNFGNGFSSMVCKGGSLFILMIVSFSMAVHSQTIVAERVRNLRVEGTGLARFPLAHLTDSPVTISFDVDAPQPEFLRIKIIHCNRNWEPTQSHFVNDEARSIPLERIPYQEAPAGVRHYRWTYTFQLPGYPGWEHFRYSGNYRIEIWDRTFTELLAHVKIFVTEEQRDTLLSIENYQLPSMTYPWYQAHRISLLYLVPPFEERQRRSIEPLNLRTCDVYINRRIDTPYRIDRDDSNPYTFVKTWGMRRLLFRIDNILPGNEYRTLDFRNVSLYPPGQLVRSLNGADLPRMFQLGQPDHDGTSTIVSGTIAADYETVSFELSTEYTTQDTLYVVGDFNGWKPSKHWILSYDTTLQRYTLNALLRRGCYDYQYVQNSDWYILEGNDWRTENVYTALLYYSDPMLGGYDRIIFSAQGKNQRFNAQEQ